MVKQVTISEKGWDNQVVDQVEFQGAGGMVSDLDMEVDELVGVVLLSEAAVRVDAGLVNEQRARGVLAEECGVDKVRRATTIEASLRDEGEGWWMLAQVGRGEVRGRFGGS